MTGGTLNFFETSPDNFLLRCVTIDESWVHHFIPEPKLQSKPWKHPDSPQPKKAKTVPSAANVIVLVFWDANGIFFGRVPPKGGDNQWGILFIIFRAIKGKL